MTERALCYQGNVQFCDREDSVLSVQSSGVQQRTVCYQFTVQVCDREDSMLSFQCSGM